MKKSDLVDIALKLFGINLLIDTLTQIRDTWIMFYPQFISDRAAAETSKVMTTMITGYAVSFCFLLLLGLVLIFASKRIARRMIRPAEDTTANFTIDKKAGIEIALIVIGGITLTKGLSSSVFYLIKLIEKIQKDIPAESAGFSNILWSVTLMFIGYILIAGRIRIARHFVRGD